MTNQAGSDPHRLYDATVARVHDAGFAAPGQAAAALLLDVLGERPLPATVLDLGCGSGASAEPLAAAGFSVAGVDPSAAMVALAQARVPSGQFRVGSIHDAGPLTRCDAVLVVGEVVNYAGAGTPSLEALDALLGRIAAALNPGGVLLLDAAGPGRSGLPPFVRIVTVGTDQVIARVAEADGWLDRFIEVHDAEHHLRDREHHRLRLLDPEAVDRCLERAGFAGQRLGPERSWTQGAPAWHAWVAVRSGG